jgi:hypothetical protein
VSQGSRGEHDGRGVGRQCLRADARGGDCLRLGGGCGGTTFGAWAARRKGTISRREEAELEVSSGRREGGGER